MREARVESVKSSKRTLERNYNGNQGSRNLWMGIETVPSSGMKGRDDGHCLKSSCTR